jgi:hypothetical protein
MEKDWDRATATYDYIMIPNKPPVRRKHKNVWTDSDYSDITPQSKLLVNPNGNLVYEHGGTNVTYYGGDDNAHQPEDQLKAVHEAN